MFNIRPVLKSYLETITVSGLDLVKDMGSTDEAIRQDGEKAVYNNSAVLLGDSYFDAETFISNNIKTRYNFQLIVAAKSQSARTALQDTVNSLCVALHGNTLGDSRIISTKILSTEPKVKEKVSFDYIIINYEILAWSSIPPGCPPEIGISVFTRTELLPNMTHYFQGTYSSNSAVSSINYTLTYNLNNTFPPTVVTENGACTYDATNWYLTPADAFEHDKTDTFYYVITITDSAGRTGSTNILIT